MESWVEFTQAYDQKGDRESGGEISLPVEAIRSYYKKGNLTGISYSYDGTTFFKLTVDQDYKEVGLRMSNAYYRAREFVATLPEVG